jgi:Major Facilitator Superfamily
MMKSGPIAAVETHQKDEPNYCMNVSPRVQGKPARFFGQYVLSGAFLLAMLGWGAGFYGPPIFLSVVIKRTGWSLGFVSSAVTIHFLCGAFVIANLPFFYRRFGLPVVTDVGAIILATGVLGWSLAWLHWQLVIAAVLTGTGWVTMGAAALNAIVSPWFVRTRVAALSTAYNGASVGGVIMSPLWATLIANYSFLIAAVVIGTTMVCIVLAMSHTIFSKTPEQLGQLPDGDVPSKTVVSLTSPNARALSETSLWRNRTFMTLATGMALGLFAQIGLIAHLFSVLAPRLGDQMAGWAMALVTACAVGGRFLVGWSMPVHADRRLVTCLSYVVQLAGSLVLLASGGERILLLILGIVLFGSGIGNNTSLPPLIAQREFVKEDVQRIVSLIIAIGQGTYAFAPAVFGFLRSFAPQLLGLPGAGSAAFFAAAALIQGMAIASFLIGRQRQAETWGS